MMPEGDHEDQRISDIKIQTEAGEEVVENGERGGCRMKFSGHCSIDGDRRAYSENGDAEVVELLPPVVPGDRWKCLCIFEGVLDIVVRDMQVGWFFLSCSTFRSGGCFCDSGG